MQRLRRVRQQIAMLVHGAALGGHFRPQRGERLLQPGGPVDDQEFRAPQAACDEASRSLPGLFRPSRGATHGNPPSSFWR